MQEKPQLGHCQQKYCFLDVETTGLYPWKHSITQLSGILEIDCEEVAGFNYFIKPDPNKDIDLKALAVQGRTLADFAEAMPASAAYEDLHKLLSKHCEKFDKTDKFFFIAYNARFDEDFVRAFFTANGNKFFGSFFWTPSIDVMQMAAIESMMERQFFPDFKLGTVAEYFLQKRTEGLHDSNVDIRLTRDLFYHLHALRKEGR